jgi:hypothetical protein
VGSSVTFTVQDGSKLRNGNTIIIDDARTVQEDLIITALSGNTVTAAHGLNGTPPAAHSSGASVVVGGNVLTVNGSDTIYRDFEVTNSDPTRIQQIYNSQEGPHMRGAGVFHSGPRTKLINLIIHDCEEGIFGSVHAVNSEVYGCVVYNNGYAALSGGFIFAGPGLYLQSDQLTRTVSNNIVFNNWSTGMQLVSQSANSIGFLVQGNIGFNNQSQQHPNRQFPLNRVPAIEVGSNNGIADQITMTGNYLYQPPGTSGISLALGYSAANGLASVTNNFLMGNANPLVVTKWSNLTFTGNSVYIGSSKPGYSNIELVIYSPAAGTTNNWDNNTYNNLFATTTPFGHRSNDISFAAWKNGTGLDTNSVYSILRPANQVIVKPNAYTPGRGNVVVYNWTGAATVNLSLSTTGLANGQNYEIRNAQNYFGTPVVTGTYNAASPNVTLPLTTAAATTVAPAVGLLPAPTTTLPEFGAFVVLPTAGPTPTPTPIPTPKSGREGSVKAHY